MKFFKISLIVAITLFAVSCQLYNTHNFDFGTGTFREPFRGPLASKPSWLVATLDWPLIKFLRPDTVCISKNVEISFNEDAVRSQSHAVIRFVDQNYQECKGITFTCNNNVLDSVGYFIAASSAPQVIKISCKVPAIYSPQKFRGFVIIEGAEIDEVNDVTLTSDIEPIFQWNLNYKYGFSYIWVVWLCLSFLLMVIVICIIRMIVFAISYLVVSTTCGYLIPLSEVSMFNLVHSKKCISKEKALAKNSKLAELISEMDKELGNNSPDGLMNTLVYERQHDGGLYVYSTNPEQKNSKIYIKGNEVICKAGCLPNDEHPNAFINRNTAMKNCVYKIDDCIECTTDKKGRTCQINCNVSKSIKLDRSEKRGNLKSIAMAKGGTSTCVGGHGIANIYGGPTEAINITPMESDLNNGKYKDMENFIYQSATKSGKEEVYMNIKMVYKNATGMPKRYIVKVIVGDKKYAYNFLNIPNKVGLFKGLKDLFV